MVELSGTIGIDFAKLLSDDLADIDDALRGEINLTYYILDYENEGSPEEFEQVILNVWIIGTDIYIQAEVFDSHLNLHIPDMQLTRMLLNLAGLSEEEGDINPFNSAVYNALPEYKEYKEQQGERIENPFEALYNASNEGFAGNILEAFVRINSQEAGIILSVAFMSEVFMLLMNPDVTSDEFQQIIDKIFTEGKLGVTYGDDFSVGLILEKVREDEDETVGYKLDFSMLHNTYISLDDQVYDEFYNRYSDEYYTDIFDECYTIAEVVQRFTVGASLTLEADFVKHILDWSTLFSVQELPTIFQIRILEAVHGLITINVSMNIDLAGGIGALDLIVKWSMRTMKDTVLLSCHRIYNHG